MRGGLEASGEGTRGDEPLAVAEVVLKRELHGVGLRVPGRRRVRGSAAGGGRRRGRGGGAGAGALELVVVVEYQLVGLEGGHEEGGGEEGGGEEGEEQETAARRGHGFAAAALEWT